MSNSDNTLTVTAADDMAEIAVMDGSLNVIANGIGKFQQSFHREFTKFAFASVLPLSKNWFRSTRMCNSTFARSKFRRQFRSTPARSEIQFMPARPSKRAER